MGKPVAVGGSPSGRGVVTSASYEARAFGVRAAMPAAAALRLCPQLIFVRGRFGDYTDFSNRLYRRVLELAPVVERASIDEMYFDLTGCEDLYHHDLPGFIKTMQKIVWKEFQLPCTIALASNKVVSKIAAQTVKPSGIIYVPHGTEREFLAPLSIDVIPGVGKKTSEVLRKKGFNLVADIQKTPAEKLHHMLGKHGSWIHDVANGIGSDELSIDHERKSIGNEQTFAHDIGDHDKLRTILFSLSEEVCSSLRYRHLKARTFTLKLRYADFETINRAATIEPTDDDAIVFRTMRELLETSYTRRLPLRLLGVRATHLIDECQLELSLFPVDGKRTQMLDAVDKIRKKFGDDVIHVGGH